MRTRRPKPTRPTRRTAKPAPRVEVDVTLPVAGGRSPLVVREVEAPLVRLTLEEWLARPTAARGLLW